jgi:hypothetical protein
MSCTRKLKKENKIAKRTQKVEETLALTASASVKTEPASLEHSLGNVFTCRGKKIMDDYPTHIHQDDLSN